MSTAAGALAQGIAVGTLSAERVDHVAREQQGQQAGQREADGANRLGDDWIAVSGRGEAAAFLFELFALAIEARPFLVQLAGELLLRIEQVPAGLGVPLDETAGSEGNLFGLFGQAFVLLGLFGERLPGQCGQPLVPRVSATGREDQQRRQHHQRRRGGRPVRHCVSSRGT
jgi:hypothetical protein